ncbi:MAG: hypothetical protein H7Y01_05650 [Ferruginibacter sp.]|nr:hypothetical protein [Chitinophagaceae bacterium]
MRALLIIIISTLVFSCKKGEALKSHELKGVLLHNITHQLLPGQKVDLFLSEYWVDNSVRDIEFPDGKPVSLVTKYSTVTDALGKYVFQFSTNHDWNYKLNVISPEYVLVRSGDQYPIPYRAIMDTLYAEKPGYIKYLINNTGAAYNNDSLFLATPGNLRYGPKAGNLNLYWSLNFFIRGEFNLSWYGGNVNAIVYDTLPSESITRHVAKWLHRRQDTIVYRIDSINVSPFTTTIYHLDY